MKIKTYPMLTFICIIIGCLITIIAAYIDYKNKIKEKQEQLDIEQSRSREYKNIINKNNTIIQSQQLVINTADEIIKLQNEVNKKNEVIYNLQNETIKNITGGEKSPKLEIMITANTFDIDIINMDKYPIKNIDVTIQRIVMDYFVETSSTEKISSNPNTLFTKEIKYGDLQIQQRKTLYIENLSESFKKCNYIIKVNWQKGKYVSSFNTEINSIGAIEVKDLYIESRLKGTNIHEAVFVNGKYCVDPK